MRRKDREISDRGTIDDIIRRCRVCRLGMCDNGQPYVVPMSFGYDGQCIYLHAATEGKKIDILQRNSRVCFEFDILDEVVPSDTACSWGMRYESVIGAGSAEIVTEREAKSAALAQIMRQYNSDAWTFDEHQLAGTLVLCIGIEEVTGKSRR